MTDAALPVTERAVERFVESYLTALGAEIRKDDRRWKVTLPEDAETEISLNDDTLVVTNDPDDVEAGEIALAPESSFVERLLDEAADRHPVGSVEFAAENVELQLPAMLTESSVEVVDYSFTPYYDREAVCALFHVGIETVSEYQSEELRAVAIDLDGGGRLPALAETYLSLAEERPEELGRGTGLDLDARVEDALEDARAAVEADVGPIIEDVRERATRAATVELEEYREYARDRLDELDSELERLSERIEETTKIVEGTSVQSERVEALRQRKELRSERNDLREEHDDLRTEIEAGFPMRKREVRDRHALTVRMRPVALTDITYERGDLELRLENRQSSIEASFSYAIGVGITEEPNCDRCDEPLSGSNPLTIAAGDLVGRRCCR